MSAFLKLSDKKLQAPGRTVIWIYDVPFYGIVVVRRRGRAGHRSRHHEQLCPADLELQQRIKYLGERRRWQELLGIAGRPFEAFS